MGVTRILVVDDEPDVEALVTQKFRRQVRKGELEFVFAHDVRIANDFERFGVHTCNWDITPYIEVLRELPKLGYLDMGMYSDMARVKNTFPGTRRAMMYWPTKFQDASFEELRRDMEKIYHELSPCDIVMADIQYSTPDMRIHQLLEICRSLEAGEEA